MCKPVLVRTLAAGLFASALFASALSAQVPSWSPEWATSGLGGTV